MAGSADKILCTTAGTAGCTTAGSCCGFVNNKASAGTKSTAMICIPAGTLINGEIKTVTAQAGITLDANKSVFAFAACAKAAAAGASTLAVSAAAAATAVYMM